MLAEAEIRGAGSRCLMKARQAGNEVFIPLRAQLQDVIYSCSLAPPAPVETLFSSPSVESQMTERAEDVMTLEVGEIIYQTVDKTTDLSCTVFRASNLLQMLP